MFGTLTLSRRSSLSYRNQSPDLLCKSMDWVLYERKLRHKGVNLILDHVLRNIIDYRNINKKHRLTEEVVTSKKSIPETL